MSHVRIIINVSDEPHTHYNGIAGSYTVPPRNKLKHGEEEFGMLVVYPRGEVQDIGEGKKVVHWPKVDSVAMDIVGLRSDAAAHSVGTSGTKEKWGLLICQATPDIPKELIGLYEEEIEFLNMNRPEVRYKTDQLTKASCAINNYEPGVREKMEELSFTIQAVKAKFEDECRKYVTKPEVFKAKRNLQHEDQRLISEGDRMWATEKERNNINETHRRAVIRLGQERPWCYIAIQLESCPGCGAMIKQNVLRCPQCSAIFDDELSILAAMPRKERFARLYPGQVLDVKEQKRA